jgi:epoxyqueuosine reductase
MEACGQNRLPGRNGVYSRPMCTIQMDKDIAVAGEIRIRRFGKPVKIIKYCRCCEFACPVGK